MNSSYSLERPIGIKIVNDETGYTEMIHAYKAADLVVNPFKVKKLQKEVVNVATESLERNFRKRLKDIFGDYDTIRSIVIEEVDARQPIQDLYYASGCIPKIIEDTTNQLYDLVVSEYNAKQREYNNDARTSANNRRIELGEGTYLLPEEYEEYSNGTGGSN